MGYDVKLHIKLYSKPSNQLNSTTTDNELCYWKKYSLLSCVIVKLIFCALILVKLVRNGSGMLATIFYNIFSLKMYILRVVIKKNDFEWKDENIDHIKKWPVLPRAG